MSEEQGKRVGVKKEEAEDANVKCSNPLCSNMPSKTAKFCGKCRTPLTVVPSTSPNLVGVPAAESAEDQQARLLRAAQARFRELKRGSGAGVREALARMSRSTELGRGDDGEATLYRWTFEINSNDDGNVMYLCQFLQGRHLPSMSADESHAMLCLRGSYEHESLVIERNELRGESQKLGAHGTDHAVAQPLSLHRNSLTSRFSVTEHSDAVHVWPGNYYSATSCEGALVLHVFRRNTNIHTTWSTFRAKEAQGPLRFETMMNDEGQSVLANALAGVATVRFNPLRPLELFENHMQVKKQQLASNIGSRPTKCLQSSDHRCIHELGQALAFYLTNGGQLESGSTPIPVHEVFNVHSDGTKEKVLTRVSWMPVSDSCPFSIRIHLFEDANETIPHCHRNNVSSMILSGSYKHTTYFVDHTADAEGATLKVLTKPAKSTEPMVETSVSARLKKLNHHEHGNFNVYFLDQTAIHTVKCENPGVPIVSIFVRDKVEGEVQFYFDDTKPTWQNEERLVEDAQTKKDILRKIQQAVIESAAVSPAGSSGSPLVTPVVSASVTSPPETWSGSGLQK